jgi:hypothetical protein
LQIELQLRFFGCKSGFLARTVRLEPHGILLKQKNTVQIFTKQQKNQMSDSIHLDKLWTCFSFTLCLCKEISKIKRLLHPLKEGRTPGKIASFFCFQIYQSAKITTSEKKGLLNFFLAAETITSKVGPGSHSIYRYVQILTLKLH